MNRYFVFLAADITGPGRLCFVPKIDALWQHLAHRPQVSQIGRHWHVVVVKFVIRAQLILALGLPGPTAIRKSEASHPTFIAGRRVVFDKLDQDNASCDAFFAI